MISHSKFFYAFVLLILFLVFGYFVYQKSFVNTNPKLTIYPESYPSGTKVSIYDKLPPSFPNGIVSQERFHYSGEVILSTGRLQATVSYMTREDILPISINYKKTLLDNGWSMLQSNKSIDYFSASFGKGVENMIVTVGQIKNGVYLVTLQYEK